MPVGVLRNQAVPILASNMERIVRSQACSRSAICAASSITTRLYWRPLPLSGSAKLQHSALPLPLTWMLLACNGCDVLIHESISPAWLAAMAPARREVFEKFSTKYHTKTTQLAELASKAKPKLLVLYHHSGNTPEELNAEMRAVYAGHFIVSRDLDAY